MPLYPPKIDNVLPAFIKSNSESVSNVQIKIPYYLNDAVGSNEYSSIKYSIKLATSNEEVCNGTSSNKGNFNSAKSCYDLTLSLAKTNFILGQYYKIQIAFVATTGSVVGYYSNAGIAKCISEPTLTVTQTNLRAVTGTFTDSTTYEKVYSYCFNLYDEFGNILETSGEQIHNNKNNTSDASSEDHWEIQCNLQPDINYTLKYSVKTVSNYEKETTGINLSYFETLLPRVESILMAENNFEEGYNKIYLSRFPSTVDNAICGNFILLRASDENDYKNWEKLINFQIYNWLYDDSDTYEIYKDFFIEQGRSYRYAIQAYNSKSIYSAKLINDNGPVFSDFEDIFLYDGERQLKIRYNPKISSFKSTILENKQDTLGSKYPHFFRNGNVNYKEFGLSGLISMLSDNNEIFFKNKSFVSENVKLRLKSNESNSNKNKVMEINNTTLSGQNYQKERDFKLEVLSWLTNGELKILKTPAEGNYIVRLMNTSLSPNDTLGRMLHTFTSTAYEVEKYDLINLNNLNFISKSHQVEREEKMLILPNDSEVTFDSNLKIDEAIIYTTPNTSITYKLKGNTTNSTITANKFGIADLTSVICDVGLSSINSATWEAGSYIQYSYLNFVEDTNSWYYIETAAANSNYNQTHYGTGILNFMQATINTDSLIVPSFPYIRVSRKTTEYVYKNEDNGKYYTSNEYTTEATLNEQKLYRVHGTDKYISGNDVSKSEVDKSTGIFCIQFVGNRENLESLGTSDKKIYRDVEDFSIGQGLEVNIRSPQKVLTLSTAATGGKKYAI